MAKQENSEEQKSQKKDAEIVVSLSLIQLKEKHKKLSADRETLHLRYHQLSGQLELVQEMIDGSFGEIKKE